VQVVQIGRRDITTNVNDGRILTLWRRLKIDPLMVG
jgi:hypothetical protein